MGIEQRSNAGARLVPGANPAGAATMRAAVQHRYGPPSGRESSEVGMPLPGRGDVLVQVGAASPADEPLLSKERTDDLPNENPEPARQPAGHPTTTKE